MFTLFLFSQFELNTFRFYIAFLVSLNRIIFIGGIYRSLIKQFEVLLADFQSLLEMYEFVRRNDILIVRTAPIKSSIARFERALPFVFYISCSLCIVPKLYPNCPVFCNDLRRH